MGWYASETGPASWDNSICGRYVVAFMLLVAVWRVAPHSLARGAIIAGWVAASTAMIPSAWMRFFGHDASAAAGVLAWLSVAGCVGLAATAADYPMRRWGGPAGPAMGFVAAVLITSLPPVGLIGMALPWVAAGALFPSTGLAGYALLMLVGALAAGLPGRMSMGGSKADRHWHWHGRPLLLVLLVATGLMIAAHLVARFRAEPWETPIAALTLEIDGPPPLPGGSAWFDLQDRLKRDTVAAIEHGSKVVLLPEGSVSFWDRGAALYWKDVAELARERHAQVLLGAYLPSGSATHGLQAMDNTLLDLVSGTAQRARANLPFGMFRPWAANGMTFPLDPFSTQGAATFAFGDALYTICYEEVLLWPLAMSSLQSTKPKAVVSVASNWFLPMGKWQSQERMIQLQARLYGLPLARSVMYGKPETGLVGTNG